MLFIVLFICFIVLSLLFFFLLFIALFSFFLLLFVNQQGNPFGDLPADATHSIIAFQVRQNRIPYAFNENDVGDVTTWEVLYAGGGRLNVEFLGYAMVDGQRRSVLVSVMDESITEENRNGDDLCPQVPMPVMLPIAKKTLFYGNFCI